MNSTQQQPAWSELSHEQKCYAIGHLSVTAPQQLAIAIAAALAAEPSTNAYRGVA